MRRGEKSRVLSDECRFLWCSEQHPDKVCNPCQWNCLNFSSFTKMSAFEKMSATPRRKPTKEDITPRRRLTNNDKLAIIEASKSAGFNKEEAMKEYGIRKTQMYDILKNKDVLETKLAASPAGSAKRVSSLPKDQIELEDRLCRWIGLKERKGMLCDGLKIKRQAQNIAKEIKLLNPVVFSDGWLRGFKKRYDLHYRIAHGEKKSADEISAERWVKEVWPLLLAQYRLEDIFNCDETGRIFSILTLECELLHVIIDLLNA